MKYNFIKHQNTWFIVFKQQEEARPVHASLYLALFQMWNINRFTASFVLSRSNLMQVAKIRSNKTYSDALKDMKRWGWLDYTSGNTFYGLSSFVLTPWPELERLIGEDGDRMFLSGEQSSTSAYTEGTPSDTPTATPERKPDDTPTDTPYNKRNTEKDKGNKPKNNNNNYDNYEEPL